MPRKPAQQASEMRRRKRARARKADTKLAVMFATVGPNERHPPAPDLTRPGYCVCGRDLANGIHLVKS